MKQIGSKGVEEVSNKKTFVINCVRKKAWRTLSAASKAAEKIYRHKIIILHPYGCALCGGYHLSSRPPVEYTIYKGILKCFRPDKEPTGSGLKIVK